MHGLFLRTGGSYLTHGRHPGWKSAVDIHRSSQKAVMIENCGMPDEKIYESAEEIPEEAGYYTLLIVKEK